MCLLAERSELVCGVDRAEFGGLSNRHDARLGVMLHALEVCNSLEQFRCELGAGGGDFDKFRAECSLWCPGLIDSNMSPVGAHHCMMRSLKRSEHIRESHDVGARSVERQTGDDVSIEQFAECVLAAHRMVVLSVSQSVTLVSFDNGPQNNGVDAGSVVTGERAFGGYRHSGAVSG